MPNSYFNKFPIIEYANNQVRNLSERIKIIHNRLINPDSYYPLELGDDTRADIAANALYQDPYMDWLLWVNNTIIDPYYGWHLSDVEFRSFIRDKYGSIEFAEQQIVYYRTAWPSENSPKLSQTTYDNVIPKSWQKYFQAIYNENTGAFKYFQQDFKDWRVSTNQMIQLKITMTTANTIFAANDIIQITSSGNVVGQAQVVEANATTVIAQHTSGNTYTPAGIQNMFNTDITATASNTIVLSQNIDLTEAVFWEPVQSYMLEEELNAQKRFISVIDNSLAMQLTSAIGKLLRA